MKQLFTFFVAVSLIGSNYSFAQSFDASKIRYGIRAGINMASIAISSERKSDLRDEGFKLKPLLSFHVGAHADYAISEAFSVQAGLTLSGKGFIETWGGEDEFDGSSFKGRYKESLLYLEIPINAVYKAGSFYFGGGPYMGLALSGKWKEQYEEGFGGGDIESDEESGKVKFSGDHGYRRRSDFGINFLAGYQVNERISIGAGYGLGLTNIAKEQNREEEQYWSDKNRVFSISVGYTF